VHTPPFFKKNINNLVMKKIYTLIFTLIFSPMGNLSSQNLSKTHHVSELFNCIFSHNIQIDIDTKPHNNIYAIYDSTLFVIHQKGFEYQTQKGYAKISKLNAFTGIEGSVFIYPSPSYMEKGGTYSHIWVWALAASDSLIFVAVDEGIWIYQITDTKQYEYVKTVSIENVSKLELVNNDLHVFVENNKGFIWSKINLLNGKIENVRQLVLNNHFFLQIAPVKIISINNNALYLLQQNEPTIEKYSLTGERLANYHLEIPNWKKIPDNITNKLDSIEDV